MDKHNGILLSHKKEWNTDKLHSMEERWKHYAKCINIIHTKGHILYYSIYVKHPELANPDTD